MERWVMPLILSVGAITFGIWFLLSARRECRRGFGKKRQ